MSKRDFYHSAVKRALQKIGWIITADPLILEFDEVMVKIDLAAERLSNSKFKLCNSGAWRLKPQLHKRSPPKVDSKRHDSPIWKS